MRGDRTKDEQYGESDTAPFPEAISSPPVCANWLAAQANEPWISTDEYRLFTDAHVTGEAILGPYQFLNTVPRHDRKRIQAAILLRIDVHVDFPMPDMTKTNAEKYHAGSFPEELAALASLALGIRLRAGNVTRSFEPNGDPKGRPFEWNSNPIDGLLLRSNPQGIVVPNPAVGSHSLDGLKILGKLPQLPTPVTIGLVRAARLYQDALWIVESEPELAWLMLVSAIEAGANCWARTLSECPLERLRDSKPELYKVLWRAHVPEILEDVARLTADILGSTRKFVNFALKFLPSPPSVRPPVGFQVDWDTSKMKKLLSVIYNYRSKALHEGTPFPAPMCEPPSRHEGWAGWEEKPSAFATSIAGSTWLGRDTPILLHVFEYIARNVLLNWWIEGAPQLA